jgi:putative ABC transport system permease protein
LGRFLWSQLRHRRSRTATLGAGILVAAVSFTLLTSAASTSELRVIGTVTEHFRPAYDILVRPPGSFSSLERERGLVRANYLSGILGGITMDQYREIKRIPGVDVAAPIANIGYIMPFTDIPVTLNDYLNDDPFQLYRIRFTWVANGGASEYPDSDGFLYYTRRDRFTVGANGLAEILPGGRTVDPCLGFVESGAGRLYRGGPFARRASEGLDCFSERSPGSRYRRVYSDFPFPPGDVGVTTYAAFPLLVAAIDPTQEQKLLDLDGTVVDGRALRASDRVRSFGDSRFGGHIVPVIGSSRTYVDEVIRVDIERLHVPESVNLPVRLSQDADTDLFVRRLAGEIVATETLSLQPIYDGLLDGFTQDPATWRSNRITYVRYWSASHVTYEQAAEGRQRPEVTHNDPTLTFSYYYGEGWAPQENADLTFRRLDTHNFLSPDPSRSTALHVVGRFDPELLPGFSELSAVPLETYYPPEIEPANRESRNALSGRPLRPTQNIADYVQQPPMMLTTLKAAKAFRDPGYVSGPFPDGLISVIRVRVAGVVGPDAISRARIESVAAAIHNRTGLAVDITAGSSPRPILIELPEGKFGRPELLLREGWVEKGVAIEFVDAIDRKSLALFGLILAICGFFLANGALASVRSRRTEIGTLLCLGWSQGAIFRAVLGEVALVGLVAGIAGTGLAAALVPAFSLEMPASRTLLVVPVALALAVLAGLFPAWRAARSVPMDAVRPAVSERGLRRRLHHVAGVAVANVARVPSRTALGAAGLAIGVAALTILVALNAAFQGVLVGTLLGNAVSVQVRGVDLASVAFTIALGGLSVADVLFLNVRERAPELVTLRTTGWRESDLRRLVLLEGLLIGGIGCLTGALFGAGIAGLVRGVPLTTVVASAGVSAAAGIAVAGLASLVPLAVVERLTPPTVLAEE